MNLELGFKRVAWVISGFGLIVSVIALVCVIFDADQKAAFGFGILGGVGWFCFVWMVFFTIRWLVRGFPGKK